jgi:hypothetical protein
MLECPVCGHRVRFRRRSDGALYFRKPRASDLAKHIFYKSGLDEQHRNWVKDVFGTFPVDYDRIRRYLEETEYKMTSEFSGIKVYRPL